MSDENTPPSTGRQVNTALPYGIRLETISMWSPKGNHVKVSGVDKESWEKRGYKDSPPKGGDPKKSRGWRKGEDTAVEPHDDKKK